MGCALRNSRSVGSTVITTDMHGKKIFIMATYLSTRHPGDGIEALNRLPPRKGAYHG